MPFLMVSTTCVAGFPCAVLTGVKRRLGIGVGVVVAVYIDHHLPTVAHNALPARLKGNLQVLTGGGADIVPDDLQQRLGNRVQIISHGHRAYLDAIATSFGADVDYGMLVKIYGPTPEHPQRRYSPAGCIGARKERIEGNPDPKHVSTSYAERNYLNVRMHSRRMTRLTNAFSKKIKNHGHAMALHFLYYNFVRIHKTLRTTPAMAAGVSKRLWEMSDVVGVLEAWEAAN